MANIKFFPGWAFHTDSGNYLCNLLQEKISTTDCTVYIGHSLGCVDALQQAQHTEHSKIVCIGGFTHFQHWPKRVLQRMISQLVKNDQTTLPQFYSRCGVPDYTPSSLDKHDIIKDLQSISNVSIQPNTNILSLHGDQDQITPASSAISTPIVISGAGHCPHITHPEECAHIIARWLHDE